MFEKLKANKGKIVSNFCAALGGTILSGIIATTAGEQLGYGALGLYIYGLFGHKFVAGLLEKKIK